MMQRWGRISLTCQMCRDKKRRCDRQRPCSNCKLRGIDCIDCKNGEATTGNSFRLRPSSKHLQQAPATPVTVEPTDNSEQLSSPVEYVNTAEADQARHNDDVLRRLKRLEDAVFQHSQPPNTASTTSSKSIQRKREFVPFALHILSQLDEQEVNGQAFLTHAISQLPPWNQASMMMSHLALSLHSYWGIFHLPSCRDTLARLYRHIEDIESTTPVDPTDLLVSFAFLASIAFSAAPELLRNLHATQEEARAAHSAYLKVAIAVLDNQCNPVQPSPAAWAAATGVFTLTTHTRGMFDAALSLRMKCFAMAQQMQVHRLDTKKRRDERLLKGFNFIEVEVQRRVWWHLVGNDWLSAFSGSPADGTYLLQPKHMNVHQPSNTNDDCITATGVTKEFPLSEPTTMSAFLYRIKVAEICREVVDVMPSAFAEEEKKAPYKTVLAMDKKFKKLLKDLPPFLQMDEESIAQSADACKSFPSMPLLRAGLHLSVQTRLCRLHRPYHFEGLKNKKYAYSSSTCVKAAQAVLDLRRALDIAGKPLGINPARSWVVMQHVFVAGLILATDVSFNPSAPHAEGLKAKVLAICDILERSIDGSGMGMQGVQRNMQTLISTLHEQRRQGSDPSTQTDPGVLGDTAVSAPLTPPSRLVDVDSAVDGFASTDVDGNAVDWDQLWTDFIGIAPDLEIPQWDMVFGDINAAISL